MTIDYDGLVTEGLAKQIAAKLREAIVEGRLAREQRLPTEDELAASFGVSRATVREALKRLAAQHLVRSRRGPTGGNFVTRPTLEEARAQVATTASLLASMGEFGLEHILEAREALEQAAAAWAVTRCEATDLSALASALDAARHKALDDVGFCSADVAFHRALVAAAHNPALDYAAATLLESLQPVVNLVVFRYRERREVIAQHERLLAALRSHDAVLARAALAAYFDTLRRQYGRALAARTPSSSGAAHG